MLASFPNIAKSLMLIGKHARKQPGYKLTQPPSVGERGRSLWPVVSCQCAYSALQAIRSAIIAGRRPPGTSFSDGKLLQGRISNRYLFFTDYKVLLVRFLYLLPSHRLLGNKEGLGIRRGWTDPSIFPIRHLVRTSLPTARPHADCRSRVGLRRRLLAYDLGPVGHCN